MTRSGTVGLLLKGFHLLPSGAKLWLRSFKSQERELYELPWIIRRGDLAIDVGANKGAYTYALARLVGHGGNIHAYEPIPALAASLSSACRQLRLPTTVHQCCLGDESGTGTLVIPVGEHGEPLTGLARLSVEETERSGIRCVVSIRRLDDELRRRARRVSFIKCDVEGHELAVFRGASHILQTDRPTLLVEIEQRHLSIPVIDHFRFFETAGYRGYYVRDDLLHEVDAAEVNSYADSGIYNFFFFPHEVATDKVLARRSAGRHNHQ